MGCDLKNFNGVPNLLNGVFALRENLLQHLGDTQYMEILRNNMKPTGVYIKKDDILLPELDCSDEEEKTPTDDLTDTPNVDTEEKKWLEEIQKKVEPRTNIFGTAVFYDWRAASCAVRLKEHIDDHNKQLELDCRDRSTTKQLGDMLACAEREEIELMQSL